MANKTVRDLTALYKQINKKLVKFSLKPLVTRVKFGIPDNNYHAQYLLDDKIILINSKWRSAPKYVLKYLLFHEAIHSTGMMHHGKSFFNIESRYNNKEFKKACLYLDHNDMWYQLAMLDRK